MKSIIFVVLQTLILFSCIKSSFQQKPVFKCELSGDTCTFKNVILNSTHSEWQPESDDPSVVTLVGFSGSTIPIITKGLCELFPLLNGLSLEGLQVEEVKEDAFHTCFELNNLRLNGNEIKELHPNTFKYTINLSTLSLGNNRITQLNDDLFANMPRLNGLYLEVGNLTEFSAKLVRNNKYLVALLLQSNDLLDIEAEKIVEDHPHLVAFTVTDNEIHCTRYVQIVNMLRSKDIQVPGGYALKERYYPTVIVFENYQKCIPDVAWMAANYRKHNSKVDQRFDELQDRGDQNLNRLEENLSKIEEQTQTNHQEMQDAQSEVDQRLHKIEEKLSKIDKLDSEIQKLVALVSQLKVLDKV